MLEYHEDDPIWGFNPSIFKISNRVFYRARQKAQFEKEVAAYLSAKELASRQIHGYLTTGNMGRHHLQSRNYRRPVTGWYDNFDYKPISRDINPRYSEPEFTNPWYIRGIGEWDQLYGDLSA